MEERLGERIKAFRKERDLTLSDLSKQTELSLGFLSNLERNQTSPTIAVLQKICNVLHISLYELLFTPSAQEQEIRIVRKEERRPLFEQDNGAIRHESMTKGNTDIVMSSMTITEEKIYLFPPHEYHELCVVVQGILEIIISNKSYYLYPGDTIYIEAGTMCSGRKASEEICVSYWCRTFSSTHEQNKVL